ncbi:FecR family protein [Aquimarina sp. 2201CG14-23]|uniref:FecR family protein n=1 Tax=Aquimarina mycalae TaxID=3040073 RepID=UPI0024780DCB|nr:FecR family protein [Aquimarina sp. 2201CG14-23]MDH7447382.1 FecR domain-containing protein [Aquimarina sp. 2201CG14-23]
MKDLILLINKFLEQDISNEELKTLENLLQKPDNLKIFNDLVKDDYLLKTANRRFNAIQSLKNIHLDDTNKPSTKIRSLKSYYKYAAIIIIAIGVTFLVQLLTTAPIKDIVVSETTIEKEILLELADGTKRTITNRDIDTIRDSRNNNIIGFLNKGVLRYLRKNTTPALAFNKIKIPYGKRFKLQLSDGSVIHLNSGSSLKYPTTFNATDNRIVSLKGEAFFDITKDPHRPFLVETNDINVEVLGTRFNVSSYLEDKEIKTTLQEGSVKVYTQKTKKEPIILIPDEQSSWDKNTKKLTKTEVDADIYTSWMKGELVFKDHNFEQIIAKLQRHYDIQIINTNKTLNNEKFTASFNNETIERVLFFFSKSYEFEFTITEKNITIE